jgi:PTH1 family peptidyl-tRNA hydrolase
MTEKLPSRGIQLIVGLGNPGPEYAATRHNVGYWLIEQLCEASRAALSLESKFKGCVAQINIGKQPCRILQPTTYMNLSGESVLAVAKFYKIAPEEILVVHDELDLPPGTARLKMDGGHGGHNGLRDIISRLGTKAFYRLRIGIGHPGNRDDVVDFVLRRPSISDRRDILDAIEHSLIVLPEVVSGNMEKAMNKLHTIATKK